MKKRIVVTGVGPITPIGIGKDAFWEALLAGKNGIERITRFDATNYAAQIAGEVKDFTVDGYIDKKEAKRMDRYAQFAVVSAGMALKDAGLDLDSVDRDRIGAYVGAGIGGYMDYQEKKLRESLANTGVDVERNGNQIKLVMPENVTFPTNSSTLNANAQNALAAAAQTLTQYPDTTLTVNGHTDNTGSDAINDPLSQRRAQAVASYLQSRGVSASRMNIFGHGSRQPIASNATVEGRAQNRRVEILINPDQNAVRAAQQQLR